MRLLRIKQVQEMTGLSRSRLYTMPGFPKALQLGERSVAWRSDEVEAWVESRPRVDAASAPGGEQ